MKILFLIILASIIYLAINHYKYQLKVKDKENFITYTPYFIDYYNQYGARNFAYYDGYMVPV